MWLSVKFAWSVWSAEELSCPGRMLGQRSHAKGVDLNLVLQPPSCWVRDLQPLTSIHDNPWFFFVHYSFSLCANGIPASHGQVQASRSHGNPVVEIQLDQILRPFCHLRPPNPFGSARTWNLSHLVSETSNFRIDHWHETRFAAHVRPRDSRVRTSFRKGKISGHTFEMHFQNFVVTSFYQEVLLWAVPASALQVPYIEVFHKQSPCVTCFGRLYSNLAMHSGLSHQSWPLTSCVLRVSRIDGSVRPGVLGEPQNEWEIWWNMTFCSEPHSKQWQFMTIPFYDSRQYATDATNININN